MTTQRSLPIYSSQQSSYIVYAFTRPSSRCSLLGDILLNQDVFNGAKLLTYTNPLPIPASSLTLSRILFEIILDIMQCSRENFKFPNNKWLFSSHESCHYGAISSCLQKCFHNIYMIMLTVLVMIVLLRVISILRYKSCL